MKVLGCSCRRHLGRFYRVSQYRMVRVYINGGINVHGETRIVSLIADVVIAGYWAI
jgi:hypothetical protein